MRAIVCNPLLFLCSPGAPQIVKRPSTEVYAARGHDAIIRMVVCADPRPRRISWEWGSMQLEGGMVMGRYKAEDLTQVRKNRSSKFYIFSSTAKNNINSCT